MYNPTCSVEISSMLLALKYLDADVDIYSAWGTVRKCTLL
jgi:hypothetical protein